jgi:hypothetical protein
VIENWKVDKGPGNENTREEILCLQFYEQKNADHNLNDEYGRNTGNDNMA